jgi:uncharacterized protein YcbK (DUF882 family)
MYLPKIRLTETLLLKKSQQKKKGGLLNKCLKQLFVISPNSLHTKATPSDCKLFLNIQQIFVVFE